MDFDDILYQTSDYKPSVYGHQTCCFINPSNSRPELHDGALLCVTDLEDCCDAPRTVRGNWYYPDGTVLLRLVLIIPLPMVQLHFKKIEVQMKSEMGHNFMAQFVSFVDGVNHQKEVVSVVRYPALLIPMLTKPSTQILVSDT